MMVGMHDAAAPGPTDDGLPRDGPTVDVDGAPLARLPGGVLLRDIVTQTDERGTLFELYDPAWGFHPLPLVYAYIATMRPHVTKGWALHELHDDRYALLYGELEVVLYDERKGSPTYGLVATVVLSEHRRRLMCIPAGIWHADRNLGDREAVIANFPTRPYDKETPDKLRLPLDTPRIPHTFPPGTKGW
jgi:dTDP-4-dehydrorhamnose 3,5-epimerase